MKKYKIFIYTLAVLNCISLWIMLLSWIIPFILSFLNPELIEKYNLTNDWLEAPLVFFGLQWWHYLIISITLVIIPAILSLYGIESKEMKELKEKHKK